MSANKLRLIGVNNGRVKPYYQSSIGLAAVGEHVERGLSDVSTDLRLSHYIICMNNIIDDN